MTSDDPTQATMQSFMLLPAGEMQRLWPQEIVNILPCYTTYSPLNQSVGSFFLVVSQCSPLQDYRDILGEMGNQHHVDAILTYVSMRGGCSNENDPALAAELNSWRWLALFVATGGTPK